MKEEGLSKIENFMWEDHEQIRRAATQCMCNLVMNEKVGIYTLSHPENGRDVIEHASIPVFPFLVRQSIIVFMNRLGYKL